MSQQHEPVSKTSMEDPHGLLLVPEPSSTPLSSEVQCIPNFSTSPDGRVTITFPTQNSQYQAISPQPARYKMTKPVSELPTGNGIQPIPERPAPLRIMTEEAFAALRDSDKHNAEHNTHSDPGGGDIEAWIESSKQTVIKFSDQEAHMPEDADNKSSQ
ncbi:unnamed protein product [Rhizoctonia solani]|uniref:Uncharacterized protein n=1 Tax=Rhizoctonia solani TaxID=456999 RepID=A0A8H3C5L6_9AGAM|nr:unnamed protein product [Rhizoctonia solani]